MPEILFRGKRIDNGEWVFGYYVCLYDNKGNISHRIYSGYAETDCGDFYPDWFEVDPKTVGLFTGLTDKNDKKIFEEDIVKVLDKHLDCVIWSRGCFCMDRQLFNYEMTYQNELHMEVIGNIHDNPELLEVENEID